MGLGAFGGGSGEPGHFAMVLVLKPAVVGMGVGGWLGGGESAIVEA